jgi:hypothetical protein
MRIFYECFESPLVSLFFAATLLVAALQILGVIPQSFWLFTLEQPAFPAFTYAYKGPQPLVLAGAL